VNELDQLREKHAGAVLWTLNKMLRGAGNTVKGVGKATAGLGNLFLRPYANWIKKSPVNAVTTGAVTALAAPELWAKGTGQHYEAAINKFKPGHPLAAAEAAAPDVSQFGHKTTSGFFGGSNMRPREVYASFTDKAREEFLEKSAKFKWNMDNPWLSVLPAVTVGAAGGALLKPSFEAMGHNLLNLIPEKFRHAQHVNEEAKSLATARGSTLGTAEAENIIMGHTQKQRTKLYANELAPARAAIVKALEKEDSIIAKGMATDQGKKVVKDSLDTLSTFAPSLAVDKKTVQSVLREALTSPEGGLSYQTIKQIADTQNSINKNDVTQLPMLGV
jgi:hypothetical protein